MFHTFWDVPASTHVHGIRKVSSLSLSYCIYKLDDICLNRSSVIYVFFLQTLSRSLQFKLKCLLAPFLFQWTPVQDGGIQVSKCNERQEFCPDVTGLQGCFWGNQPIGQERGVDETLCLRKKCAAALTTIAWCDVTSRWSAMLNQFGGCEHENNSTARWGLKKRCAVSTLGFGVKQKSVPR